MLDYRDAQLDRARAEMDRRVTELRDEWSAGVAHQVAAAEAASRQRQEDHVAWLARFTNGAADEPAPEQDVAGVGGPGVGASPAESGASDVRARPRPQQPTQQEMAAAVRDMDLAEYGQLRAELGIGSTSARGLFGG